MELLANIDALSPLSYSSRLPMSSKEMFGVFIRTWSIGRRRSDVQTVRSSRLASLSEVSPTSTHSRPKLLPVLRHRCHLRRPSAFFCPPCPFRVRPLWRGSRQCLPIRSSPCVVLGRPRPRSEGSRQRMATASCCELNLPQVACSQSASSHHLVLFTWTVEARLASWSKVSSASLALPARSRRGLAHAVFLGLIALMGVLVIATLLVKRSLEHPKRPWKIWCVSSRFTARAHGQRGQLG